MKLSSVLAQKIVREMMKVIPYNINVMDEQGKIIGSGSEERIGQIHEGARQAIRTRCVNEIIMPGPSVKPGVNEPIFFDDTVIGVIGITGHPDEVRKFSKLVRVTAVLLIEQEKIHAQAQDQELEMQKFYQELVFRKTGYDESFQKKAQAYGLKLTNECQAILVKSSKKISENLPLCKNYPHYYSLDRDLVFFTTRKNILDCLLSDIAAYSELIDKISVGGPADTFAQSLEQARRTLTVGLRIKPSVSVYFYHDLEFFIRLSHSQSRQIQRLMFSLESTGNRSVFVQTLQTYIEENGDINQTAERLMIHRNTLTYRLKKIEQLTGKDPKVLLELFELLCALLWWNETDSSI